MAILSCIGLFILGLWYIAFMAEFFENAISDKLTNDDISLTRRVIAGIVCGPVGWWILLTTKL